MATFNAHGPFEIPLKIIGTQARFVDADAVKALVRQLPEFAKIGCYVFVVAYPKGEVPIYVGKTGKGTLKSEPFNPRNLRAIDQYINKLGKNYQLRLYLITQINSKGAKDRSSISEIEDFLIAKAARRNADLLNVHGIGKPSWSISGVAHSNRGQPTSVATKFKKALGL
jgi:hypothetical protein